jgi:glycosyltransferase involved in cell wall biosynthesis
LAPGAVANNKGALAIKTLMKKNANNLISITIPTYNRAPFLDACLEYHIPLARKHNVKIFISDNASDDYTQEVVKRRCAEYSLISYIRNQDNVGADANFEQALKLADTEYVWLLGDTYTIPEKGLDYLVNLLTSCSANYDLIVFNWKNRVKDTMSQDYADPNKILSDIGWHMTCLSTLVYRVDMLRVCNFKSYLDTYFIQTGIIFDYISSHDHLIHWNRNISVETLFIDGVKKNTWAKYRFEIWFERWPKFIFSLPPVFLLSSKIKAIKDHGVKSKAFSIKNLLMMRFNNGLNLSVCKKYRYIMPLTISHPRVLIFLFIAILPIVFIKFFKWLFRI